jgi:putative hydrolase of the HAD superfamily
MITNKKYVVVLDLDDTLYNEIDFLKSAFQEIASCISDEINKPSKLIFSEMMEYYENGLNVFDEIITLNNLKKVSTDDMLGIYRNHKPLIKLTNSAHNVLLNIKNEAFKVGLITDGRSMQQRNKINALGLTDYFDDIIISEEFGSEKPNINNFKYFEDKYGNTCEYVYVGDNVKKDFMAPNGLGWITICLLDNGKNIHKQSFGLEKNGHPFYKVNELKEITEILFKQDKLSQ